MQRFPSGLLRWLCVKDVDHVNCHRSAVAGRKAHGSIMMLGSFVVVKIPGGKFSMLLDAEAVVDHVLSTVMYYGTVAQLIVAQSLQRLNQCLSQ